MIFIVHRIGCVWKTSFTDPVKYLDCNCSKMLGNQSPNFLELSMIQAISGKKKELVGYKFQWSIQHHIVLLTINFQNFVTILKNHNSVMENDITIQFETMTQN